MDDLRFYIALMLSISVQFVQLLEKRAFQVPIDQNYKDSVWNGMINYKILLIDEIFPRVKRERLCKVYVTICKERVSCYADFSFHLGEESCIIRNQNYFVSGEIITFLSFPQ